MNDGGFPTEGSTIYYSLWRVPHRQRDQVCKLLAFFGTLATTLHEVTEPTVAEQKIHWWHEELERLGHGNPRHPDAVNVAPVLQAQGIRVKEFLPLMQANNEEKFHNASDEADLHHRLEQDYGTRLALCERILQPGTNTGIGTPVTTLQPAWARGVGEVERLRQLPYLHHRAYPVFPDSVYTRYHLAPEELFLPAQREAATQLLKNRIDNAVESLSQALALGSNAGDVHPSLPLRIYAELRKRQLERWHREPLQLLSGSISLTPMRKFWVAWRLHRRG
ncbi:MAG: squalene/phytoene synthase family protein [Gammaproteobacteria bacterium]|nr:squalene/phytoene synthase family protein [Gammaproteobacteria bacterium]